jgi:hypothetical protein
MARFDASDARPVGFDAGMSRPGPPADIRMSPQRPRTLVMWREDVRPAGLAPTLDPPGRGLTDYAGEAPAARRRTPLALDPTVPALTPVTAPGDPVRPAEVPRGRWPRPWLLAALLAVLTAAGWSSAFSRVARPPSPPAVPEGAGSRLAFVAVDVLAPAATAPPPAAPVAAPARNRPERRRPRARRHLAWSDQARALIPVDP